MSTLWVHQNSKVIYGGFLQPSFQKHRLFSFTEMPGWGEYGNIKLQSYFISVALVELHYASGYFKSNVFYANKRNNKCGFEGHHS